MADATVFCVFPCDTEVLNPSGCTAFVDVVHEFEKMERKAPESFQQGTNAEGEDVYTQAKMAGYKNSEGATGASEEGQTPTTCGYGPVQFSKKNYSTHHIECLDTCMEH